jgi:hypothetical protein
MRAIILLFSISALLMSGCSTVTIRPQGGEKLRTAPTYSDSKAFFLFGKIGTHHIDVKEICGERKVAQMQTQGTFLDGFLGFITLGIYAPRTAKVWCE